MKRMGAPSGSFDVERNMSYTNLAAMASSFETGARLVPQAWRRQADRNQEAPYKLSFQYLQLPNPNPNSG